MRTKLLPGDRCVVLALSICLSAAVTLAERPLRLHPDNPHYFLWQERPTILVTSGEHYGALLNLDFDYLRYLEALQADGLNHTRTFSGIYREVPASFGITENTLAPKPHRYSCPWARSDVPGYADGGNKFDLTRWDPDYFRRLRDFMTCAASCGVVVEFNLFCPFYKEELWQANPMNAENNVKGIGRCPREEVYTLQHPDLLQVQLAVTRKIVAELRDFGNLYYEVCNEPYFGGVTIPWQHRIVDTIVAAETGFPQQHLISMNIANGRQQVTEPHPDVSIFNFHYCVPPDTVDMNYGLDRVIGENETGFRGSADVLYRTEGWMFLLAGGALYNNLDYSFTAGHPDGTLRDYQSPGGGSPELRRQLGILKTFLEAFDLPRLRPLQSAVRDVEPKLAYRVLAAPGRAYAIYLHVPLPKKVQRSEDPVAPPQRVRLEVDLPAGNYAATWVDTKTSQEAKAEAVAHHGGPLTLVSPEFVDDVALRILKAD